jgi:adenylate cyclase
MKFLKNRRFWFYARRAFWIFITWVAISNFIFFYDYITLVSQGALNSDYDFTSSFTAYLIVSVCASFIGGVFSINLMEFWLRRYAMWKALVLIIVVYTLVAVFVGSIGSLYMNSENMELPMFHPDVMKELLLFYGKAIFIKNYIVWLFIVLATLVLALVNDKYGPGVFPDYLMGRYFKPKNERRIFMFADIKNATGIAETLGEEKYFNFLKDFFKDIAPAIVQTRGEIYQYVGDEIVVSWKMKWGIKNANALQCFYSMQELIAKKSHVYLQKYSVSPKFKVGFHFGPVMVGEIGQIKREIAFSGDVLNTTARIVALCNDLGVEILASKEFSDIAYELPSGVSIVQVGDEALRGKAEKMALVTYKRNSI